MWFEGVGMKHDAILKKSCLFTLAFIPRYSSRITPFLFCGQMILEPIGNVVADSEIKPK